MKKSVSYERTMWACYIGYITQGIVNNLPTLLFLTFRSQFGIPLAQIALISTINFGIQLLVDSVSAGICDKIGYRPCMLAAHITCAVGLIGYGVFPFLFPNAYAGLLLSVFLCAIGGGLCEVLVSPIAEACPTKNKAAQMSLLHSFYCWGVVGVIVLSTLFFAAFGIANWRVLCCLWALVPIVNIYNFAVVPITHIDEAQGESMPLKKLLGMRMFWLLAVLMVCSGASELAMAQWASTFVEEALKVNKTVGDLLGPCVFAVLMGIARTFYGKNSEKIDMIRFMIMSGALCVVCYLLASLSGSPWLGLAGCALCGLSVGIMWPGTFNVATVALRGGGTAMFALLALAGDVGGSVGPAVINLFSSLAGGDLKMGILAGIVFPAVMIIGLVILKRGERPKG